MKDFMKQILISIGFADRYLRLVTIHHHRPGEYLQEYDENEMIGLVQKSIGRSDVTLLKSERSFIIQDVVKEFKIIFGIRLGYGGAGVYTNVFQNDVLVGDGQWSSWYRDLEGELPEDSPEAPYPRPSYASLAEVEQLVAEAYAIYEALKKALAEQLEKEG